MNIQVFNHSSIKLSDLKNIYFDPYMLITEARDADYIFITHDHYDHYDEDSIKKILKNTTYLIVPKLLEEQAKTLTDKVIAVEPNKTYQLDGITFDTIPSYNQEKPFHPKEKEYVGYNVTVNNQKYYIMGDTDRTEESNEVKTDICFVPIGGTYTMNVEEAIEYINYIKPKKVIPIHYGSIVGDIKLGEEFKNQIDEGIEVEIQIK